MATCPNKEMYSLYLDKELSSSKSLSYERHLEECAECKNQLNKVKSIQQSLQSLTIDYDAEEGYKKLKDRMRYKTVTSSQRPFSTSTFFVRFTSVAAAVLLFSIIVPVLRSSREKNTQDSMILTSYSLNPLVSGESNVDSALMLDRGVVFEETLAYHKLITESRYGQVVTTEFFKYPVVDYFEPQMFKVQPVVEINCLDVPSSTIVEEQDLFGFSQPVFLLRE